MQIRMHLCLLLLLAACSDTSAGPFTVSPLQPYHTRTPAGTNTPWVILADTPMPTPTPINYVIQPGDTVSELAETFNVLQDDLLAANPGLNPNSLTIGSTILVPGGSSTASGTSALTPVPLPILQTKCHPTMDSGLWCFALVHNDTPNVMENINVHINLMDSSGVILAGGSASFPLDILPSNASLPAYAFFPDVPRNARIQAQLMSALQLNSSGTRYLPVILDNTLTQIAWDGFSAQLSGRIHLPADSAPSSRVRVAAVAYDHAGNVVGVRRWEGEAVGSGESLPFAFRISSAGDGIETVDFVVEAQP